LIPQLPSPFFVSPNSKFTHIFEEWRRRSAWVGVLGHDAFVTSSLLEGVGIMAAVLIAAAFLFQLTVLDG
jgi:Mg/Co/Ni transporter MgtE